MPGRVILRKRPGAPQRPISIDGLLATCAGGLDRFVIRELEALGLKPKGVSPSLVRCDGDLDAMIRMNAQLRTASRVLVPILDRPVAAFDDIYRVVGELPWERIVPPESTFSISATTRHTRMRDHRFLAMRAKDAIVDRQRRTTGSRSSVDRDEPTVPVVVHLDATGRIQLSLDSTGRPLHERGYRRRAGEAPLRETVAAAMVLAAWGGDDAPAVVMDPFCGSGTIVIEAAFHAIGRFSSDLGRSYAWQRWPWLRDLAAAARTTGTAGAASAQNSPRVRPPTRIVASDSDPAMVDLARANAERAGVAHLIEFAVADAAEAIARIKPNARERRAAMISNPPYGRRLDPADLDSIYRRVGAAIRETPTRWDLWLITSYPAAERTLGVPLSAKIKVFNGSLEADILESRNSVQGARQRR